VRTLQLHDMLVAMATRTGISMWSEETGGEEQHQHETVLYNWKLKRGYCNAPGSSQASCRACAWFDCCIGVSELGRSGVEGTFLEQNELY
jgi:hypothetical protein